MSVGHIARLLEEAGVATVTVAVKAFQRRLEAMYTPRVIITPYLVGRPLGRPGDREGQRKVLEAALNLLETATEVGTIRELPRE